MVAGPLEALVAKDHLRVGHAGPSGAEARLAALRAAVQTDVLAGGPPVAAVRVATVAAVAVAASGVRAPQRAVEREAAVVDAPVAVVVRVAGAVARERASIGPDGRPVLAAAQVGAAPAQQAVGEAAAVVEAAIAATYVAAVPVAALGGPHAGPVE